VAFDRDVGHLFEASFARGKQFDWRTLGLEQRAHQQGGFAGRTVIADVKARYGRLTIFRCALPVAHAGFDGEMLVHGRLQVVVAGYVSA